MRGWPRAEIAPNGKVTPAAEAVIAQAVASTVVSVRTEVNIRMAIAGAFVAAALFALGVLDGAGLLHKFLIGSADFSGFIGGVGAALAAGLIVSFPTPWAGMAFDEGRQRFWHWGAAAVGLVLTVVIGVLNNWGDPPALPGWQ